MSERLQRGTEDSIKNGLSPVSVIQLMRAHVSSPGKVTRRRLVKFIKSGLLIFRHVFFLCVVLSNCSFNETYFSSLFSMSEWVIEATSHRATRKRERERDSQVLAWSSPDSERINFLDKHSNEHSGEGMLAWDGTPKATMND